VATAIVNGAGGPEAFSASDERAAALANRVSVKAAADLTAAWPAQSTARVVVELPDRTLRAEVENPLGHESRRLSGEQLREKFETLVVAPDGSGPRVSYERLLELEQIEDLSDLLSADGPGDR
jgi:2-methylcitrate dehydratase PrpD